MPPEDSAKTPPRTTHLLVMLAAVGVIIAGLRLAQPFFVPVILAFFIATVSFPITAWLRKHRVPRAVAVLLTVLVDFMFLAGIVVLGVSMVGDLQGKWDEKYRALTVTRINEGSAVLVETLEGWGVENAREQVDGYFRDQSIEQLNQIDFGKILSVGTDVVGRLASFFGTTVLVMILTVFMLTEARMFGRRLGAVHAARGPNLQRMLSATKDVQRFLAIKTAISLATGVLAGFLCWAAGLDFFVLWGLTAYALNYVPVVGSIIAGVPPTVLALLTGGVSDAVAVAGGYILINMFLGNFIEPLLMGRRFGLSTLVVVLSVLFWGFVWGPSGMLLSVPLTMMVKVMLDNSEEFRWLGIAIGKDETHRPSDLAAVPLSEPSPSAAPASAEAKQS